MHVAVCSPSFPGSAWERTVCDALRPSERGSPLAASCFGRFGRFAGAAGKEARFLGVLRMPGSPCNVEQTRKRARPRECSRGRALVDTRATAPGSAGTRPSHPPVYHIRGPISSQILRHFALFGRIAHRGGGGCIHTATRYTEGQGPAGEGGARRPGRRRGEHPALWNVRFCTEPSREIRRRPQNLILKV